MGKIGRRRLGEKLSRLLYQTGRERLWGGKQGLREVKDRTEVRDRRLCCRETEIESRVQ